MTTMRRTMMRRTRTSSVRNPSIGRREAIRMGASLAGLFAIGDAPACDPSGIDQCTLAPAADRPLPRGEDWVTGARVAGISTAGDATVCDVQATLDSFAAARVSVVEIDPDLSLYLSDAEFATNVATVDLIARECHARGMRAIAYYPVLEVLSPNADQGAPTMSVDHPDWVQVFTNGQRNTFMGTGTGLVFWVDPGEESAWMCPTSGYVDYFLGRIAKLVSGSVIDGLWCDVPLLSDISTQGHWPCTNPTCRARFAQDNPGFVLPDPIPAAWPTFDDPTFRQWVIWRHKIIHDLEQQIVSRAQSIRPEVRMIVETVTMDYNAGTEQGLDGAAFDDGTVGRVWEVDAVSDGTAMRSAAATDWLSMAVMMKHARGAARSQPTWAICYGSAEDDAEYVMALAIAAGCAPYESRIPVLDDSVGQAYRARMFGWLEQHPEVLATPSSHDVAVLYSSTSRDALAPYANIGSALYVTTALPAGEDPSNWWSTEEDDAASGSPYVAEVRGMGAILIAARTPFDYLTTPHADATALAGYSLVVAPSPASLSSSIVSALVGYVEQGGTLVVTGNEAGAYDELGTAQAGPALLTALGVALPARGWSSVPLGAGRVVHTPLRAGMLAFAGLPVDLAPLRSTLPPPRVSVDAPPSATLVLELRTTAAGDLLVLVANLTGLGAMPGMFTPQPVSFNVTLPSGGRRVAVTVSRPDAGVADADPLVSIAAAGAVSFPMSVTALALATVRFS
jgi:hypothetical protein